MNPTAVTDICFYKKLANISEQLKLRATCSVTLDVSKVKRVVKNEQSALLNISLMQPPLCHKKQQPLRDKRIKIFIFYSYILNERFSLSFNIVSTICTTLISSQQHIVIHMKSNSNSVFSLYKNHCLGTFMSAT